MEHGAGNEALQQQLGEPLRTGPWYNASVGVTHGGLIGNCTLSMVGSRHSADVAIRVRASIFTVGVCWSVRSYDAKVETGE